jgi:hypothetical protein
LRGKKSPDRRFFGVLCAKRNKLLDPASSLRASVQNLINIHECEYLYHKDCRKPGVRKFRQPVQGQHRKGKPAPQEQGPQSHNDRHRPAGTKPDKSFHHNTPYLYMDLTWDFASINYKKTEKSVTFFSNLLIPRM